MRMLSSESERLSRLVAEAGGPTAFDLRSFFDVPGISCSYSHQSLEIDFAEFDCSDGRESLLECVDERVAGVVGGNFGTFGSCFGRFSLQ